MVHRPHIDFVSSPPFFGDHYLVGRLEVGANGIYRLATTSRGEGSS